MQFGLKLYHPVKTLPFSNSPRFKKKKKTKVSRSSQPPPHKNGSIHKRMVAQKITIHYSWQLKNNPLHNSSSTIPIFIFLLNFTTELHHPNENDKIRMDEITGGCVVDNGYFLCKIIRSHVSDEKF